MPYKRSIYFINPVFISALRRIQVLKFLQDFWNIENTFSWILARFPKFFFVTHTHTTTHTHTHNSWLHGQMQIWTRKLLRLIPNRLQKILLPCWQLHQLDLRVALRVVPSHGLLVFENKVAGKKTRGEWEIGFLLLLHFQSLKIGKMWDTPTHLNTKTEVSQRSKGRKKSKM
jgi:hypothetical protein